MTDIFQEQFFTRLRAAVADQTFVRLNLGAPVGRENTVRNIFVRPVDLRGSRHLSFVYRHPTRDVTKNLEPGEAFELLEELLRHSFLNAFLSTTTGTAQLTFRKGRPTRLVLGKAEVDTAPDTGHDRTKERLVSVRANWLRELGVTTDRASVRPGMEAKYRQIHRFLELLDPLLAEAPFPAEGPLRLTDMGCGKGYLTFAAYEHLQRVAGRPATVRGVEARAELVELANRVAGESQFDGLEFVAGTIADTALGATDILVALHACDTATDDALAQGIVVGAALLVVAPCCHQEVRPQLTAPPVLADALRHGIFRERQAEFVTDALRAALLEAAGYDTRVCEFISPEHTSKNLMIAAVKRTGPVDTAALRDRARALAAWYGVREQRLARHLGIALA